MKHAPGYGNIFQEACLLEEKCGDYQKAIEIAEKGLEDNPRYGPLYLTILRLHEKVSNGDLTKTREIVERAIKLIPKELKWKIYYEAAQIEDRAGNLEISRQDYVKSVSHCPNNLLWKVWLAGTFNFQLENST
jgi:tetratricopeptide (TPR) repeat protein